MDKQKEKKMTCNHPGIYYDHEGNKRCSSCDEIIERSEDLIAS